MAKWQTQCTGMTGATIAGMAVQMQAVRDAIAVNEQQVLAAADTALWNATANAMQTLMTALGASPTSKWRMQISADTGKYIQLMIEKQ